MGFVQGARHVPGGSRVEIPHDVEIEELVMVACQSFSEYYPVLVGSVRELVHKLVRNHQPVDRGRMVTAAAELAAVEEADVDAAVDEMVTDELLTVDADGRLRLPEH